MLTFLAVIVSLSGLYQSPEDSLQQRIELQAESYVQHIRDGEQPDEHFWALLQVMDSSKEVESMVLDRVRPHAGESLYLGLLAVQDSLRFLPVLKRAALQTGSSFLSAAYLTNTGINLRKDFEKKFRARHPNHPLLELFKHFAHGTAVTDSVFAPTPFHPVHFLVLYSPQQDIRFQEGYVEDALDYWRREETEDPFRHYTVLQAAYNLYKDGIVSSTYEFIIEDDFFPSSLLKLQTLNRLEFSLYTTGNFDFAINLLKRHSIPLANFLNHRELKLKFQERLGVNLFSIGKYEQAERVYENLSLMLESNLGSVLLNNLGITYYALGEVNKYLQTQLLALDKAIAEKRLNRELQIYKNLHIYHLSNNNFEAAESYLKKAQSIITEDTNPADVANIYLALGAFYWESKNDKQNALLNINRGLKLVTNNEYKRFTDLISEKANILFENGDYDKTRSLLDTIKTLALEKSDAKTYLDSQIKLAEIALIEGDITEVRNIFSEIDAYNLENLDFDVIVKARTIETELLIREDKYREAYAHLSPTIDQIIERSRNSTDFQTGYWNIETEYVDAFDTITRVLIELDRKTEALSLLDDLKTINDASFYNNPLIKGNKLTESELTEDKRLGRKLSELRKKLLSANETEQVSIQSQIDQIAAQKQALLQKVNNEVAFDKVPVRTLQYRLNAVQVLVQITELNDKLYKAVVTNEEITFEAIAFDEQTKQLYGEVTEELALGNTDLEKLYTIYRHLNLSGLPDDKPEVLFIPGSYLYRIPIDILPVEPPVSPVSYGAASYFIEEKKVYYLSSIQEFFKNFRSKNSSFDISLNAYGISDFNAIKEKELVPLPFAKKEAEAIETGLQSFANKKVFIGEQATKEHLVDFMPQSGIVHLATHSEVSERDPLFSTVYLNRDKNTGKDDDGGRLFAYEFFNLNLDSDLVVLNSCSSGSGDYMQGTGVMGLTRALRYAGARSLMLNLWSVNDKLASDFALKFYEELGKGASKAEAIRRAKLSFLKNGNANPHHWGVYMLVGNPSPVKNITSSEIRSYAILSGLFLLVFVGAGSRRRKN